ncbi:succinate dehydrogenase assembly factor 2 [Hyphomonas sp. WL0036]|uniref:FAD assembly factor SdhE n=1 Tax=Hyphomonas sediminis TaxID=2866160 RepID=UPI001C8278D0|nr:succinate dehydrogenase assembly factor 2 [Hyphomonas sediminis]MBY9067808.1 succinate dehydrogenase assembly factor 2 [Hyphomonas sediminis]
MEDSRRSKLKFRAWRRGFRELDLLIGSFADAHLDSLDEAGLDEFERLLDVADWEMFAWLVSREPVPANYQGPVLDQLIAFRYAPRGG